MCHSWEFVGCLVWLCLLCGWVSSSFVSGLLMLFDGFRCSYGWEFSNSWVRCVSDKSCSILADVHIELACRVSTPVWRLCCLFLECGSGSSGGFRPVGAMQTLTWDIQPRWVGGPKTYPGSSLQYKRRHCK